MKKISLWLSEAILYFIYHFIRTIYQIISKMITPFIKFFNLCQKKLTIIQCKIFSKIKTIINILKKNIKIHYPMIKIKKFKTKKKIPIKLIGPIFVMPWIIGATLFTLLSLITVIYYSFNKVLITPSGINAAFVGLDNYKNIFLVNIQFRQDLVSVFTPIIINIPVIIVVSIFISLLLNTNIKGTGFFRTIFFLPVIILSGSAATLLIETGQFGASGLSDYYLYQLLAEQENLMITIILYLIDNITVILWYTGIPIIIFLVILQNINGDLYEAADMDGASTWNKFWKVTLPELKIGINITILYLVMYLGMISNNPIVIEIKSKMFDISGNYGLGYASAESLIYMFCLLLSIGLLLLIVNGFPKVRKKNKLVNYNNEEKEHKKNVNFRKLRKRRDNE